MIDTEENKVIDNNELEYLLALLDDEDENIYSSIKERFIQHGDYSVDYLKKHLDNENFLIKKRANEIISILKFEEIESKFAVLAMKGSNEILEEAMMLISQFGYPAISVKDYTDKIEKMYLEILSSLVKIDPDINSIPPIEVLNTINNYLFFEKAYKGNTENYYDPDNSYINKVIDTKLGNPIALSVLYILISKKLGLPVFGINLPGHFIIKYSNVREEFFIDPFNKGVLISKKDAKEFLKKAGMATDDLESIPYLRATSDKEIVLRILRNLIEVYKEKNEAVKSAQLEKLMNSLL